VSGADGPSERSVGYALSEERRVCDSC
jgi:hypothetical protein